MNKYIILGKNICKYVFILSINGFILSSKWIISIWIISDHSIFNLHFSCVQSCNTYLKAYTSIRSFFDIYLLIENSIKYKWRLVHYYTLNIWNWCTKCWNEANFHFDFSYFKIFAKRNDLNLFDKKSFFNGLSFV